MKRKALEKHLKANGCLLHHHGAKHDVWVNPKTLDISAVPRHPTVKRGTVRAICKQLGIAKPAGL